MGLEVGCCYLKKAILLLTKLHFFLKANTNWLYSDTSGMLCRDEWVLIALVLCQNQSSAHPTRNHLWKPTGKHGLSLFPFLLWSRIFTTFQLKEATKDLGCNSSKYCQSYQHNWCEVRCKGLLITQKCLEELLGTPLYLSNWLRIVSCQMTWFSLQEISIG